MTILVIMMTRTMVVVPTLLTLIGHKLVRSVIRALRSHHLATYIKCKVDYRWSSKYLITASAHHHIADTTPLQPTLHQHFTWRPLTFAWIYAIPACLESSCATCIESWSQLWLSTNQIKSTGSAHAFLSFSVENWMRMLNYFFAEIWRTSTPEHRKLKFQKYVLRNGTSYQH